MRRISTMSVLLVIAVTSLAISAEPREERQESWAQPVDLKGVPNLHRVSDSLYRSAQPTAEGMRSLKDLGVATVVNLRSFHSDRDEIGTTELAYEHIYMKAWHPERKEAVRFLQIVTDPKRTPVLVHCQHGADRTGTMTAIYRIAVQGWSKEEAIREMTKGGFGFNEVWDNLPEWIRDLDIDSIRKEAGLDKTQERPTATVTGNIATRVVFKGADADEAAAACLALLASCHYSQVPAEGPLAGWQDIYSEVFNTRGHLHIRFLKPQTVKCADGGRVEVSEMLVLLPLNNGGLRVRVGDKAKRFGKWEHDKCVALQRLLKSAEPAE